MPILSQELPQGLLKKRSTRLILLFLIMAVGIALRIGYGHQKSVYHVDEGYSYLVSSLGLSEFNALMHAERPIPFKGKDFLVLYQLRPEDGGKHHLIEKLIAEDVHPPLYYHALHEVMRWSGGKQSKWQGIGLNLGLYASSLILLYALARRLAPQTPAIALLGTALWSLSTGAITLTLFARMYELQVFLGLISSYCWLAYLQSSQSLRARILWAVGLGLSLGLGYMTHYYTLVFGFLLTLGGAWLLRHSWKRALGLVVTWAASVIGLFMVYPTAWQHLFQSQRGQEIQALSGKLQNILLNMVAFSKVDLQFMLYTEVLLLSVCLMAWAYWQSKPNFSEISRWCKENSPAVSLGVVVLVFGIITAGISPFQTIRYHALILPLVAVGLACLPFLRVQLQQRTAIAALLLLSFAIHTGMYQNPSEWINPLHTKDSKPASSAAQLLLLRDSKDSSVLWGALSGLSPDRQYLLARHTHLEAQGNQPPAASRFFAPEQISMIQNLAQGSTFYMLDLGQ